MKADAVTLDLYVTDMTNLLNGGKSFAGDAVPYARLPPYAIGWEAVEEVLEPLRKPRKRLDCCIKLAHTGHRCGLGGEVEGPPQKRPLGAVRAHCLLAPAATLPTLTDPCNDC